MLTALDHTFEHTSNKLTLLLADTQRQESRLRGLVDAGEARVAELEGEKTSRGRVKVQRELEVEDVIREIKGVDEERQSLLHVKGMELSNMKGALE